MAAARAERLRVAPPPKNVSIKKTEDGEVLQEEEKLHIVLPLIIMTDVAGTGDAVIHELEKIPTDEHLEVRVTRGVGAITEGDVKRAGSAKPAGIIVGFNVKVEREARDLAERLGVEIEVFDIIYKLGEWLGAKLEERRPRQKQESTTGAAKIVKIFSNAKGRVVLGGKVEEGTLRVGEEVRLMRRDLELARGEITSLQSGKSPVKKVETGSEFGAQVKLGIEPTPGDRLEAFEVVFK